MKKIIALTSIFLSFFVIHNQSSKAARTPYQSIIVASAVNYCGAEYGYLTDKQAFDMIIKWGKHKHNLEPFQVSNLMLRTSWGKDTDDFIDKNGGCEKINEVVFDSLDSNPSGFKSLMNGKKDYEYYYDIDL